MRTTLIPVYLLAILPWALLGQTTPQIPAECQAVLDAIRNGSADHFNSNIEDSLKLGLSPTCYAKLFIQSSAAAKRGFADFVKQLEALRTDKQAGSSVDPGASTNLVSKGTTARLLSVASEFGAITESVSGQTVTVQGSLDGLPSALVRKSVLPYCLPTSPNEKGCIGQGWFDALGRFSYGVSFNTSQNSQTVTGTASGQAQGAAQPATFTASSRQITAWNARAILWNARQETTTKDFTTRWQKLLDQAKAAAGGATPKTATPAAAPAANAAAADPSATATITAAKALLKPLEDLIVAAAIPQDKRDAWYKAAFQAISAADLKAPGALELAWWRQIATYLQLVADANPKAADAALAFIRALSNYEFEQRQFIKAIANKPVLTLQYNDNRPVGQSSTSTVRLIFDKGVGKGVSIALNGAFTLYNSNLPTDIPGVSRLRDAQFATQVQKDLGSLAFIGAAAVAGSYYFQYQNSPAILNVTPGTPLPGITFVGLPSTASQVFAQKGNLHVGQIRLVLGAGGSSVRFPLAISYSNRTELIPKATWRAQLGISYDFDALFSK
jgi:hypothetical protein